MSISRTQDDLRIRIGAAREFASLADKAFLIQVAKYGLAGVISASVDLGIFYVLANVVLPCIDTGFGDDLRAHRFVVDKTAAFVIANAFSYWLNAGWVFTPGRHSRKTEIALFFAISTTAYVIGLMLGRSLIGDFGMSTHLAAITCIIVATVINFVFRKLVIFKN
ncbi:GtrA family protein [Planctomycetes bacterium TBK1r]|uniref:GtrA-like protein n=1 Tax=Stieleria magnilauensis TaxID=2527963 RepID=A0ABX5XUM8_9BACT|nr:GtrA-like protein [Planctomycetes bacterium TBK1r]